MTLKKIQIQSRRKVLQLSAAFFMLLLSATACKKEFTNIGDGLEEGSLNQQFTDTFSLITYSDEVDSVQTDETAVNLLGAYIDPVFGKVECGIVTQMMLTSVNPAFGNSANIIMDSVVLSLRFTSLNYYANLQPMTFEVYEITDGLVRDDQDYYAFTTPNTTGTNLVEPGFETQTPDIVSDQIVGTDTLPAHLRIRLDQSFGMDMVALNDAGSMATSEGFTSAFKGLYIKVNSSGLSTGTGTILYHVLENSISGVTMYFHDNTDLIAKEYSFEFNSKGARYNTFNFDRTGTDVEAVLANQNLGAENFYVQGSAIRGVIEVPHLLNFNYDSLGNWDPKIINKAELILPVQDFTMDVFDPSVSLFIAKVVDANLSTTTLDYAGSSGSLLTVKYDDQAKEYRFLVTREIQAMLTGEREFTGFRIYSPSFFGSTIERIVFNGAQSSLKNRPRLEITYTNY